MSWLGFVALCLVGFVAAVINVIAGGGSFLTLPLLITRAWRMWLIDHTATFGTSNDLLPRR